MNGMAAAEGAEEEEKEEKEEENCCEHELQFFGTPKPKSGSGWINLPFSFTMSHREKNDEVHKIFGQLPTSEKLIDDYSCALQRDILVHGRLYITQNWLCFYANIFAWETLLTIPFTTVISITKERTALLIPNAMQISTTVEKYGFSSFIQRDISYNVIFKVWQNSLLDQPLSARELVKAARKAWGDGTDVGTEEELWGLSSSSDSKHSPKSLRHQNSLPTHLEIGQVSSGMPVTNEPMVTRAVSGGGSSEAGITNHKRLKPPTIATAHRRSQSAVENTNTSNQSDQPNDTTTTSTVTPKVTVRQNAVGREEEESSTGSSSMNKSLEQQQRKEGISPVSEGVDRTTPPSAGKDGGVGESGGDSSAEFEAYDFPDQGEVPCGCSEHAGRTILNEVYNGEVERIFQLLFTDSDFYRSFLKSRKTTNIEISEWSTQADGTRLRDISYTLSLNYSFGPKYSSCTEHQIYFKNGQPGVKHIVQLDVINGNVPYGDAFYVSCRFCMTRVAHNKTRLRVTSNICFRKNCWGVVKNLIERNAGDGLRSYYSHLDTALKEYMASLPAKRLQQKNKRSSRRRHRRQSSVPKQDDDGGTSSSLRKRRGSISSRVSLKSAAENGTISAEDDSASKENRRFLPSLQSLPKVNLALTILLGLLVMFNVVLYHQLMSYQTLPPTPPSTLSASLSHSSGKPTTTGGEMASDNVEWPNSPEEWKNLFKEYWQHEQEDKKQLSALLQGVVDTLQEVENAISTTRTHLLAHRNDLRNPVRTDNEQNTDGSRNPND